MKGFLFALSGVSAAFGLLLGGVILSNYLPQQIQNLGSVAQSNEYYATTTQGGTLQELNLTTTTGDIYETKQGALGSVVITLAAANSIEIFDTTTTDRTKRAANLTTSSIRMASFPASVAAGTYTFDEVYRRGLIVVFSGSNPPTSTFTYR